MKKKSKKSTFMIKPLLFLSSIFFYSTSLSANKNVEWNLAMSWKSTLTPKASPSFKIAQMVREMSNGRFIIKISGQEKHQSTKSILEVVQNNKYQMGHSTSSNWQEIDINTVWFTSMPFGMTTNEQLTWFYHGDGKKYMSKVFDKFNVFVFPGGDMGTQSGGWSKKEIKDISDFKGLKINRNGINDEILSLHGVQLQNIKTSQLANSFLNNNLDIISSRSPSIDIKMGFHKIAPYYYTSWDKPSSPTQFLINKEAYEKLPTSYQKMITLAMKTASYDLFYKNFYLSSKAWNKIQKEYPNIKVKSLPTSVLKELKNSTRLVFENYSKENKLFKEIYKNQKKFLQETRKWSILGEYSYIKTTNEIK